LTRKSADSLTTRPAGGKPSVLRPRDDCPPSVRRIFLELVSSVAADHFQPGDAPLLEQYAQAILLARQAYDKLATEGPVIDGKASPWLVVLEKAHRSAVALSARLRLAPQARADARSAARKADGARPSAYDLIREFEND
jgi:phage terminase small subunit